MLTLAIQICTFIPCTEVDMLPWCLHKVWLPGHH